MGTYYYRLKQIDFDGSYKFSSDTAVIADALLKFSLSQNYPNPTIRYQLSEDSKVALIVYDILANKEKTLVNEEKAGYNEVRFYGSRESIFTD